jgi:[methyl-Co(III) methanol-specific corrinoid protein]:coenzyme M methyltransferase
MDVEKECLIALEKGVNVLAPSCSVAPYSPLNNIKAMVNARNKYYKE